MAFTKLSIKRHNHRVYFSSAEQKSELLALIASQHPQLNIAVVAEGDVTLPEHPSIVVLQEVTEPYDMIITYDFPDESAHYIARLAFAKSFAFVLMTPEEESKLYPVETALGRGLVQERLEGFALPQQVKANKEVAGIEPKAAAKPVKAVKEGALHNATLIGTDADGNKMFRKKRSEEEKKPRHTHSKRDDKRPFKPKRDDKPREEGKTSEGKRPFKAKPTGDKPYGEQGNKPYVKGKKTFSKPKSHGSKEGKPSGQRAGGKKFTPKGKRPSKEG